MTKQSAASVFKALNGSRITSSVTRPAFINSQRHFSPQRNFSTSRPGFFKEFFPEPDSPHIKTTEAAWQHPVYTYDQMNSVKVAHRDLRSWQDRVAITAVRVLRWGLDLATGYKHDHAVSLGKKDPAAANKKCAMTERKYMIR